MVVYILEQKLLSWFSLSVLVFFSCFLHSRTDIPCHDTMLWLVKGPLVLSSVRPQVAQLDLRISDAAVQLCHGGEISTDSVLVDIAKLVSRLRSWVSGVCLISKVNSLTPLFRPSDRASIVANSVRLDWCISHRAGFSLFQHWQWRCESWLAFFAALWRVLLLPCAALVLYNQNSLSRGNQGLKKSLGIFIALDSFLQDIFMYTVFKGKISTSVVNCEYN